MLNAERMANAGMENANVSAGINPTFDRSRQRGMLPAQSTIYDRSPFELLLWKSWMRFRKGKYLARKSQDQSTCIDQSLGTLTITGSGSPFSSALDTASSYEVP